MRSEAFYTSRDVIKDCQVTGVLQLLETAKAGLAQLVRLNHRPVRDRAHVRIVGLHVAAAEVAELLLVLRCRRRAVLVGRRRRWPVLFGRRLLRLLFLVRLVRRLDGVGIRCRHHHARGTVFVEARRRGHPLDDFLGRHLFHFHYLAQQQVRADNQCQLGGEERVNDEQFHGAHGLHHHHAGGRRTDHGHGHLHRFRFLTTTCASRTNI